jgi:Protein of unknown function (DUF2637)
MSNIRVIRVLSLLIMVAAASVSFGTQRAVFTDWHCDGYAAVVAPLSIDLLAILCNLALHTDNVASRGRKVAALVLVITMGGSLTANWTAGLTIGSKAVHAGIVLLYVLAEWVSSTVKAAPPVVDPKRSEAARRAASTRKANAARRTRAPRAPKKATTVAELEQAYSLPSAPVSPAV